MWSSSVLFLFVLLFSVQDAYSERKTHRAQCIGEIYFGINNSCVTLLEQTKMDMKMHGKKQNKTTAPDQFLFLGCGLKIRPQRHDWCMNVWLCVCVCSTCCSSPTRLNALKLRWRCLRFVPDLIQGNSTEAHDLSRDVQKQLFGFHSPPQWGFSSHVCITQQPVSKQSTCVHSILMWGAFIFPRLCLEFYQPYCLCVCVLFKLHPCI